MFSKKKPGAADDEPPGDGGGAKPSRLRSLSLRSRKKDGAAKPKDDGEAPLLKSSRLNFYSEYKERRQREHLEQIKQDSQLQERLAQEVERDKMEAEEKHSWEAYELPGRNRLRLIRVHTEAQAKLSAKRVAVAKKEVKDQEEGFTYHNSVLKQFLRWRDSPALQRYYTGHKGQVYAFKMADSLDCVLSASEDTTLKLWDFHTGKCVRTFEGHGKAVRDCDLSPQFSLSNRAGLGLAVSCSTDKTLRIWDARTGATRREMRGHTDVIYAARFRPDGKHVCSASADRTVRLWDAVEGHLVYVFRGHKSAVVSAAYSSSGRFIASASDYGERAIKVWDADMPGVKSATNVLQRVQWTKEGLISRFLLFVDPPKALLEDPSKRRDRAAIAKRGAANGDAWDALSDGEGEEDESERVERERDEKQSDAAASDDGGLMAGDVREACGFSLSVASVDRFQRRTQVESYFGNVQLQLVLRGVGDISEFFVGGYGRAQVHDAFVSESGERRGEFARELPLGMRHACGKAAVNSRRFAPRPEVVLDWRAPEAGGGAVVLRCTVAGEDGVRRALSYTLAEVEAPKKGSLLSDAAAAGKATAQKFDFTASVLHQLFIELVRNGDFSEAASMVGPNARLKVRAAKRLEDFVKGKEAVLARVLEYMANGVSFVKEANDVDPGKSAAVVVHGEPLEYPESDAEPEARDLDAGLDEAKLKRGDDEMRHVRKLRGRRLACAEEVRLLYAPASVPGKEAKRKEAAADFFIAEGKYGGAIPHMQMPLPETYPLNARTDAGAERARKGREAMNTGPPGAQKGRKAKGPDALWPSSRAERKAVARGLARVAEQRTIAARNESSSRRNAHVLLPGFEGLSTDLGTAPHVRAAAATAAGQPFYPFPDRGGARQLLRIKADVEAKAGALKSSRFSAFSLGASIRSRTSALGSPLSPISSRRGTPLGSTQDLLLSPLGSRRGSPLGSRRGSPVGSTQDLLLSSLGSPLGSPLGSQQTLSLEDGSPAGTPVAPHSSRLSSSAAISLTRPETPQSRPSSRGAAGASPQLSRPSSSRSAILSRPSTRGASPLRPSSRGASGASPQSSRPSSRGASPPPSRPSSRGATGASPTRPSSRDSRPSSRGASPLPSRPSSRGASGAPPHSSRRSSHGALERRPSISAGGLRPLTPSTGLLLETSESLSASPLSSKGTAGGRTFLLDDDGEDEDEDSPAFEGDTGGADGKIATAPRLRRRNSFATLPGLAPKPASAIAEAQKSGRETIRAKLRGGCRLTFRVTENDFHAHHHTVNEVTWSVDERRVASCSNDRTVRLWEPESGRCVRTLVGHDDAVMGAGFSEDGLRLVSCGMDNFLILWNTLNGAMLRRFFGHDDVVYRCVLFKNASAILSCSSDRTLKSWVLTPQPPDAPHKPLVTGAGQHAAVVAWRAPPAYNEQVVAYKIENRIGLRDAFGDAVTVDGLTFKKEVNGLRAGQNYQFRVCAENRMGQGAWSEPSAQHVTDVDVPEHLGQPVIVRARLAPRSITFCWRAPLATVEGTAIQHFRIECAGEGFDFGKRTGFARSISWKAGRTVAVDVEQDLARQVEKDADVSQSTGPASRGRAPKIDGALQSAADDDDGDAAAQRARRGRRATKQAHRRHALLDAAKKTKVAPTATGGVLMGMTFEGLQPGLDYRFRVAAVSSIGQGPFSASTSNTRASSDRPARPLAPNCVALSKTSVRVTWCAPMEHGASVKRYELQRLDEPDAPPQEFSRFHATMDFVDLLAGRKYSFAVRAFNVIGASEWSEASEPTTTLTDIAETPQRPDIVSTAITTVDLAVEKPDNSGRVVSALLVQRRELRTGGVRSEWANEQSFAPPPGGAGVRCPMRLEPLLPDTVYQFRCAAVNAHGTSPWSLPTFRARTLPAELPWAPGVPVPGDRFPGAVELAWAAAEPRGAKVVGHVLQSKRLRRTSVLPEAPPEAQAAEHGAPAPAAVDDAGSLQGILTESEIGSRPNFRAEALEKSAKYVVRIAAVNSVGQGPFSPWSSVFACLQTD